MDKEYEVFIMKYMDNDITTEEMQTLQYYIDTNPQCKKDFEIYLSMLDSFEKIKKSTPTLDYTFNEYVMAKVKEIGMLKLVNEKNIKIGILCTPFVIISAFVIYFLASNISIGIDLSVVQYYINIAWQSVCNVFSLIGYYIVNFRMYIDTGIITNIYKIAIIVVFTFGSVAYFMQPTRKYV